jgi:transcriptional regulator with XRE-family HTH domain
MKLGSNIRKIRELRNIKQEYIANKLKLSLTSYGKIERDETDLGFNRLENIANILGVSLVSLICFTDERFLDALNCVHPGGVSVNMLIEHLLSDIYKLTEEKNRLFSLIENMVKTNSQII